MRSLPNVAIVEVLFVKSDYLVIARSARCDEAIPKCNGDCSPALALGASVGLSPALAMT